MNQIRPILVFMKHIMLKGKEETILMHVVTGTSRVLKNNVAGDCLSKEDMRNAKDQNIAKRGETHSKGEMGICKGPGVRIQHV